MVVIEFDLPRSVSLSALDESNVTLKDAPDSLGQESNKMVPRATLICRPNSHPFQERYLTLESAVKIGRSVARVKPALNNAIFDCKVLSRNHALLWYKDGKFYLQDTKSSNGTFVNNQRLSKGSEESIPREVCSGDIVQFGVDVMENSRKVTHGCIVATLKLYLPDGKEAKASPSTGIIDEEESCDLGKRDLYQLNQWIQEAVIREQILENKLATLQRILTATREAAELGWTALMEEDRLLTRIESLENQLVMCSKNLNEDKLREEVRKLYEEKSVYQDVAKESLRKVLVDKMETLKKLQETERSLSNAEDERDNLKELNEKLTQQVVDLAERCQKEAEEINEYKGKLKEAEELQNRLEQEIQIRQEIFRDAKAKETILLAQMESRQAEVDFTKEQLANLRVRLESVKTTEEKKENEVDGKDQKEEEDEKEKNKQKEQEESEIEILKLRVADLESQLEAAKSNAVNGEHIEDPVGFKTSEMKRLQELLEETRQHCRGLESEIERRQLEAQDGWAAAAQLQQYLRNLHNVLIDSTISNKEDGDDDDEPSNMAMKIGAKISFLKKEHEDVIATNRKNSELVTVLQGQIENYKEECKTKEAEKEMDASSSAVEVLSEEVASLNNHLKELTQSRQELLDECQKWQEAYQGLVCKIENRDSGVVSEVNSPVSSRVGSRGPEIKDSSALNFIEDEVDVTTQLLETRNELEVLKRQYETAQSEKKGLEAEYKELKENYSLLSSQSKTVGRWMCMVPLAVLVLAVLIAFRPAD